LIFGLGDEGKGLTLPLAGDDDDLPLAALIDGKATVAAVLPAIGGLHIAARVHAVDFNFTRDRRAVIASGQSFPDFMGQHESGLVLTV
jgi:hypothetical protein